MSPHGAAMVVMRPSSTCVGPLTDLAISRLEFEEFGVPKAQEIGGEIWGYDSSDSSACVWAKLGDNLTNSCGGIVFLEFDSTRVLRSQVIDLHSGPDDRPFAASWDPDLNEPITLASSFIIRSQVNRQLHIVVAGVAREDIKKLKIGIGIRNSVIKDVAPRGRFLLIQSVAASDESYVMTAIGSGNRTSKFISCITSEGQTLSISNLLDD
jgi:hypothetical protein